jgi:hypothetical protein
MRSFISELVRVAKVFIPVAVFCLILSSQLMREVSPKPGVSNEKQEVAAENTKDMVCLSKKQEPDLYLFFEQMTR